MTGMLGSTYLTNGVAQSTSLASSAARSPNCHALCHMWAGRCCLARAVRNMLTNISTTSCRVLNAPAKISLTSQKTNLKLSSRRSEYGHLKRQKRRFGGRKNSSLNPYRPPAVLDVETTGLDRTIDEIIEIGAVDGTGRTLIDSKIKSMKPISAGAAAKHHISASDLLSAPTLVEYWPQISEALTGRTIICYNIEFDIDTMLITNAARSGLRWFPAASACAMNAY